MCHFLNRVFLAVNFIFMVNLAFAAREEGVASASWKAEIIKKFTAEFGVTASTDKLRITWNREGENFIMPTNNNLKIKAPSLKGVSYRKLIQSIVALPNSFADG